ncbi:hypothetical protein ANRL3_03010 [Anaerolineae bacterium]|nr:hypothetical protein ANRL3_03010 [Anaerolineae bacterium]
MSKNRIMSVQIKVNIAQREKVTLREVLGQNVSAVLWDLLQSRVGTLTWANDPSLNGWPRAGADCFECSVTGTHLVIRIKQDSGADLEVSIVGSSSLIVNQNLEVKERQRLEALLQKEIRTHQTDCNHLFNLLVNEAMREAIHRVAQKQGVVIGKWETDSAHHEGTARRIDTLRVRQHISR